MNSEEKLYQPFSKSIHVHAAKNGIPVEGTLELTRRCNLRCVHCYVNEALGDKESCQAEMDTAMVRDVLEQAKSAGCFWVLVTGGEPLVRDDWLDVHDHARKQGLLVTLFTNATLVTPAIAKHLGRSKPFLVEVSIYGNRDTHDNITGVPGSFEKSIRGVKLLLAENIPVRIKTVVISVNIDELDDVRTMASQLGIGHRYDLIVMRRCDGDARPYRYRLPPQQVVEMEVKDIYRRQVLAGRKDSSKREGWTAPFSCGAASYGFQIDAMGRMGFCGGLDELRIDLRSTSFESAWQQLKQAMTRYRALLKHPACLACDVADYCDMCPLWSKLEHGDISSPVEFFCDLANERAKVAPHLGVEGSSTVTPPAAIGCILGSDSAEHAP